MKIRSLTVLMLATGVAFAQDSTVVTKTVTMTRTEGPKQESPVLLSKKGEPILPQKGDWAIGIDATPFFSYAGNIFNATVNNAAPTFSPSFPLSVYGKYFTTDRTAIRANVVLGFSTLTESNYVIQDATTPDPAVTVKDSRKTTSSSVTLAGGKEKRRGSGRVQGFYGAQGVIMLSTNREVYTYGNPMSATFNSPTSSDFDAGTSGPLTNRVVENKTGTRVGAGIRGFIGAEIFVFPKLSVGGELGVGIGFISRGEGTVVSERWDTGNSDIKRETTKIGGEKQVGFDTWGPSQLGLNTGSLTIMFHF